MNPIELNRIIFRQLTRNIWQIFDKKKRGVEVLITELRAAIDFLWIIVVDAAVLVMASKK